MPKLDKSEFKKRTVGYIVAALGLVAGLAWNDAIKSTIEYIFPAEAGSLWAKFIYAFLITVAIVFLSINLQSLFLREEE